MPALSEIGRILKEERIKRGLSLDDIHRKTKISKDVLKEIEENPYYIEKEPYARFLIKQLIKELDIPIKIEEKISEESIDTKVIDKKPERSSPYITAAILFLFHFFRFSFVIITFLTLFYLSQTTTVSHVKDRLLELVSFSTYLNKNPIEIVSYTEVHRDGKKIDDIVLKANSDIWLTAYIDGKEVILKLKKGETKKLTFCNKIRFETIGNATDLEMVFNNKKVKVSHNRKIIHNVFVDSEGIFINGYNIVE